MKKIITLFCILLFCGSVNAQNISLDLKDAPVRSTIEMIFKQAGVKNYVIDNSVSGFVTLTLTDQPFENSLKLVMRASTIPLTYIKENDVWIVKERVVTTTSKTAVPDLIPEIKNKSYERIPLTYIDPFDLMSVLGNILFINQFQRYQGGLNGQFSNMGLGGNNGSLGNNSNNPGNQNGARRS